MVNSLTREASVKFGPILLETLLRHYFDRIVKENASGDRLTTQLRKDELLYDEAFVVVKVRSCLLGWLLGLAHPDLASVDVHGSSFKVSRDKMRCGRASLDGFIA
jgi:hypothetical protein